MVTAVLYQGNTALLAACSPENKPCLFKGQFPPADDRDAADGAQGVEGFAGVGSVKFAGRFPERRVGEMIIIWLGVRVLVLAQLAKS